MMPFFPLKSLLRAAASARTLVVVLTMAMLPSLAAALPLFSVAAAPPASGGGCGGGNFVANSATPVSVDHTCGDGIGSTSSNANATFGSVGAAARSVTFSSISVPRIDESSASFRDTLVFSKTNSSLPDQFSVSLNLALAGILNAGAPSSGANGVAGLEIDVSFLGQWMFDVNYASDGSLNYSVLNTIVKTGTLAPGADGFDILLATPSQLASIGSAEFGFSIYTRAGSVGTNASATADFLHTLKLPTGVDVFTLPPGYTVNAGDYLVNNRFTNGPVAVPEIGAVPEPGTLGLLAAGLAGLASLRRRRKATP